MRYLVAAINGLVVALLAVVVLLVTAEVVLRYVFLESLIVADELSRYLMIWVAFLAAALCVREDLHVRILVLVGLMRGRARRFVEAIAALATMVFLAILFWEGARILPDVRDQDTTTLGVSIMWFYLAIPVGAGLMILFLAISHFRGTRSTVADDERGTGI